MFQTEGMAHAKGLGLQRACFKEQRGDSTAWSRVGKEENDGGRDERCQQGWDDIGLHRSG